MKYITLFEQQTAFDNAKSTLDKPNMSLVTETGNVYSLTEGGGVTYEYVDLGLPSRLKWAKCNVGASSETDYGGYFMWGSTRPNKAYECTWTYAPFNNGVNSYNSSYFESVKDSVCPNGVLAKEYDTATQIMGGDWRMPTKDELKELIDNTVNEWDTINGVDGWKFTHKTDTSKYIFIPATGYYLGGSVTNVGLNGGVWSSSLDTSSPDGAWYLGFNSGRCYMGNDYGRCYGQCVRGVRK